MKESTALGVGASSKGRAGSQAKRRRQSTMGFQIKELGKETWPDFERMVEKHNGVWGGCWCTFFHLAASEHKQWSGKHREYKEKLVRANRSHAALVYDGPDVVGWCQFGPLVELPGRMRGYGTMDPLRPIGGLPASSSTATIDARELRGPHCKAHSASSPQEGAGRLTDIQSTFPEGKNTRAHLSGAEPSQCT